MNVRKRIRNLQSLLANPVVVSDPTDIFYYTGHQPGVDDHPLLLVRKTGKPVLLVSQLIGNIKTYAELQSQDELPKLLPKRVGIDEHHLPAGIFQEMRKTSTVVSAGGIIKKPREVKDSEELELMKKAIRIDKNVLASVDIFSREADVVQDIESRFRDVGASPAFETIVASGSNAGNYIHHFPDNRIARKKDMIIVDFGSRWKGYSSDVTRTYVFRKDKKQTRIFETVTQIQQECIDMIRPGMKFGEINDYHSRELKKAGFQPRHGIGHGIGVFVHEEATELREGMVITIEPGVYIKNFGGCRIEDMILVKKKPKVLSRIIPSLGSR